jgi:hypothetical protein
MRIPTFKLFIWRGIQNDYSEGFGFAYARNVEEARAMLLEQLGTGNLNKEDYKKVLGEPDEIIITPCAELVRGSA